MSSSSSSVGVHFCIISAFCPPASCLHHKQSLSHQHPVHVLFTAVKNYFQVIAVANHIKDCYSQLVGLLPLSSKETVTCQVCLLFFKSRILQQMLILLSQRNCTSEDCQLSLVSQGNLVIKPSHKLSFDILQSFTDLFIKSPFVYNYNFDIHDIINNAQGIIMVYKAS